MRIEGGRLGGDAWPPNSRWLRSGERPRRIQHLLWLGAFAAVLSCQGAAALAQSVGARGCDAGERELRFAYDAPAEPHPVGAAATQFAETINRDLDGRLCVTLRSTAAGGAETARAMALDALRGGAADMAAAPVSAYREIAPALQIFDLPFLFRSKDAALWFQHSGAGQRLKRSVGGGLRPLVFWNAGMKQILSAKPLLGPNEAAGLVFLDRGGALSGAALGRIGAQSAVARGAVGAAALAAAMERSGAAALEATWAELEGGALADRLGVATQTDHALDAFLLVVSAAFWEALPLNDQLALNRTLARVSAQAAEGLERAEPGRKAMLAAAGLRVVSLDETQRAAWRAAFDPYWRERAATVGPALLEEALVAGR